VKDGVALVGEASLQENALGRQVPFHDHADKAGLGASLFPDLDQRLGDLGGEALPPGATREGVDYFQFWNAFQLGVTQTGAANEGSVVCPERPQTETMVGPVTEIGLQLGGRHRRRSDASEKP